MLKLRCGSLVAVSPPPMYHMASSLSLSSLKMSSRVFKMLINSSWSTRLVVNVVRYQSCKYVSDVTCWRCNKEISLSSDEEMFTCPCDRKVLLPPITKNYFIIMGW